MFVEDYYRRLIKQQCKLTPKEIKTDRPWYPKRQQNETKKEEYRFFMLPPNKMVTLLKKNKFSAPNDRIKEFLHNHSLKQIVDFGETLQSTLDMKVQRPSIQIPIPKNTPTGRQLFPVKRRPLQLPSTRVITEPSKKSSSQCRSVHKFIRLKQSDHSNEELYNIITKLNYSPLHVDTTSICKKQIQPQKVIQPQPYIKPEIPKSVLPYPPRTKKQLRQFLLRALKKIKALGLTIKYVMEHKIFSKKPYEKINSKEFIHAAKQNKKEDIENYLQINPYLVFDYDFYNMTALHWACKKGYLEIVEILLKYHSDIDGVDILYRTPLMLSIQENHLEVAHLLLTNGAYPWSTAITDLKSVLEENERAKLLLTRVRRLQIMAKWTQSGEYLNLI
ncbi:unnamed protein product [Paramecium octaurelia]|uniref:Ankyrin repeat domain-containing protein n=1 Tax=Paramecium octaurelia TaxID=43137 RepID=A0A8S1S9G6_PAROT|nr:unnamed protein product [Paramecium octaurelia]